MNIRLVLALVATVVAASWPAAAAAADEWKYEMGWRYVKYTDSRGSLLLQIEPMVKDADVVYVPDRAAWAKNSPAWAKQSAAQVLRRLKSVPWHRNLRWVETDRGTFVRDELPLEGSLESTSGGRTLEGYRLFHPDSKVTHEQAHQIWHTASRRFAEGASGRVTLVANAVNPDTVFGAIEVPALRANPNVTLEWR